MNPAMCVFALTLCVILMQKKFLLFLGERTITFIMSPEARLKINDHTAALLLGLQMRLFAIK